MGEKTEIRVERNLFGTGVKGATKSYKASDKMSRAIRLAANYYGRTESDLINVVMDQFLQAQLHEIPGLQELIDED